MPDSPPRFRLAVLGPLRAHRGGAQLDLGPVRQQALLAALVLNPGVTVSQQELLDGVWGSEPPGTGSKVVPVYIHRLRRCLRGAGENPSESLIDRDRGGYRFVGDGVWVDAARLEEIVGEAGAAEEAGDLAAAVDAFSGALELFRGEPLAGLPGPYAEGQRRRLAERRVALLQDKLERQLRLGWHAEAVGELSALTPVHPHSEPLAALLMRALYASGRRADALEAFTGLRRRLVNDLGVEPGEDLRRVQHAVLRGDDDRLGVARRKAAASEAAAAPPWPPVRDEVPVRDELPVDVGELIGRDCELALLTGSAGPGLPPVDVVDGVAGSGKTALAVRAAQLLRDRYPDGCLFVDLHGHTEGRQALAPRRAPRRLLRAVGVDENAIPDDLDELAASWRTATAGLRLLLVLDDAAGAEQVRPLLPAGAASGVLVTSRRRLAGLDVGHRVSLGPLGLDAAERLLSGIVGEARADGERDAVRELARLCGRLPLALRIAGARLQNRPAWTFEYLVARLADGGRRLTELTAEDRSVEGAFRLSYDQLPAAERRAFRLLGLSPTVELDRLALAAMLGCPPWDAERALESLVDASMLQQPAVGRYRPHELVAVYARRLALREPAETVAEARTGVLGLYVAAARHASDWGVAGYPTGPEPDAVPFTGWADAAAWLDAGAGELADVVAHAAAVGHTDHACWIAEGLVDYLTGQGRYRESRAALEIALPLAGVATDRRMISSLRICLGITYAMQGRHAQARAWFADALQAARRTGDLREQARALAGLGAVARSVGRHARAITYLGEALELAGGLDDDWLTGMAICDIGVVHHRLGRHEEALDCFAQALVLAEKIGSPRMTAKTLCASGGLHLDLDRPAEAAAALRRAVELAGQAGAVPLRALGLTRLGTAEQELGNLNAAVRLHRRALAAVTEQTGAELEIEARNRLGASYLAAGGLAQAREQFELVLVLTEGNGDPDERTRAIDGLDRCGQLSERWSTVMNATRSPQPGSRPMPASAEPVGRYPGADLLQQGARL